MSTDVVSQALDSLTQHKFRSALTLLGIVWGIVAVTVLMAYGDGFRATITHAFDAFGPDVVVCWPGQTSEQAGGERAGQRVRFEIEDVERIKAECPLVRTVSPELVRTSTIATSERTVSTAIRGVWPSYGKIRNETVASGRFLIDDDVHEKRHVVFLGSMIRQKLFGNADPVGQIVTLAGQRFVVIGYSDKRIQFSNYFRPDSESVFIPFNSMGDLFSNKYLSVMVWDPIWTGASAASVKQVREMMARTHRFSPTDKRAIQPFTRDEFRPVIDGITIGLQIFLIVIGGLTLGIGGVGVMNIMLVSVTERTREIGIRKAIGATKRRILLQFMIEALTLTLLGGVIGMVVSWGIIKGIGVLPLLGEQFKDSSGAGDIQLGISTSTLTLSTLLLALVGLISGLLPAMKAARMDPVEALRYE
jgi:putative ABC transport system permease protein